MNFVQTDTEIFQFFKKN